MASGVGRSGCAPIYVAAVAPLGFDRAFRRHVVLADVGAFGTLYSVVALWWPLPFAAAGLVVGFAAALANSLIGGGGDA